MAPHAISFTPQLEQLEGREVPAVYAWSPDTNNPPPNKNWSTSANWLRDGVRAQVPPGTNDAVQLPDGAASGWTKADVPTVQSVSGPANKAVYVDLLANLTVTNSFNVDSLLLDSDTPTETNASLTVTSGGAFIVSNWLKISKTNLIFGSPTDHTVTSTLNASSNQADGSYLSRSTITNYGTSTIQGIELAGLLGTNSIVNGTGGTLEVRAKLTFVGELDNDGEAKVIMPTNGSLVIHPNVLNTATFRVFPGTLSFDGWFSQPHGLFQLRGVTVKMTSTQPLSKELFIRDGAIAGTGVIDGDLGLGADNTSPSISPGIDDGNPATMDTGKLEVKGKFTIYSTSATVNMEVVSATSRDEIVVGGQATVKGVLTVTVGAGYQPGAGTKLDLITSTSITGQFDEVNLLPPTPWQDPNNGNRLVHWVVYRNPGVTEYDLEAMFM